MKKRNNKTITIKSYVNTLTPMVLRSICTFASALLLCAIVCFFMNVDYDKYYLFFIFSTVFSSFLSGFINSRKKKKNGILNGFAASIPIALSILIIALIVNGYNISTLLPITIICTLLSGAVSGSLGVNLGR